MGEEGLERLNKNITRLALLPSVGQSVGQLLETVTRLLSLIDEPDRLTRLCKRLEQLVAELGHESEPRAPMNVKF